MSSETFLGRWRAPSSPGLPSATRYAETCFWRILTRRCSVSWGIRRCGRSYSAWTKVKTGRTRSSDQSERSRRINASDHHHKNPVCNQKLVTRLSLHSTSKLIVYHSTHAIHNLLLFTCTLWFWASVGSFFLWFLEFCKNKTKFPLIEKRFVNLCLL